MTKIADFKPSSQLSAEAQLKAFINWAKETLPKGIPDRVHASIRWDDESWHAHGFESCAFRALGSTQGTPVYMPHPFADFVKAVMVYRRVYQTKKSVKSWLEALRYLEVALAELTGTRDITRVSAAVCNQACEYMRKRLSGINSDYNISKSLESIITLMHDKKLLTREFRWTSPLEQESRTTLKQRKLDQEQKLPNPDAIKALGEIFNNDMTSPLDIVVTSACAILLSAPSRIGELADVERDCVVFKCGVNGKQRMFLRWYAEKINKPLLKPVVKPEMQPVIERAIALLKPITDEARAYAAWLEDHPNEFPPHDGLPKKGGDDPLTYAEVCAALKLSTRTNSSPRSVFKNLVLVPMSKRKALSPAARTILDDIREGWDSSRGKPIFVQGKLGVQGHEFNDQGVITLHKLNVLMREKYLPRDFPYTTSYIEGKARVKYRDALFTVRTGALINESMNSAVMEKDFGVEIAANPARMASQLAGKSKFPGVSIFERYGYVGLKVNTHAFRHELNTEMHRAGLSQLLIDAFSGRADRGSVYNHVTVEERTQAVASYHPKTKYSNAARRLEKVKTNQPLSLSDVRDLHEDDQDRIIHQTHVGICVHNFAAESCPKMGACLSCGRLGCVKGDDVKLANLKEERDDIKRRYGNARDAQSRDAFGASEWVKSVGADLLKCEALIQTLENPDVENGDIVWNVDNGWTLTNNAAAMAGLIDARAIEEKNEQEVLPTLDDLSAMLDEIKV